MQKAVDFYEKFVRAGGTVSITEFQEFNETDQKAFLIAGLLVEELKLKQLEWIITSCTTLDSVTSRTMTLKNRILNDKLSTKKVK